MKTATFADKTTLQVSDASTVNEIIVTVPVNKVGDVITQVSPANLTAVSIGDAVAQEVIFQNCDIDREGDNVTLHFHSRFLTDQELLLRRIADLEDTITTLTEE